MQQKYCDQGRSVVMLTTTCPIRCSRSISDAGGAARMASNFPSVRSRAHSAVGFTAQGLVTQVTSLLGSNPTYAAMLARKRCGGDPKPGDTYALPLEIPDRADALVSEQLETTNVEAREQDDWFARIDPKDRRRAERHADVGRAGGKDLRDTGSHMHLYVLHVGEPFTL